MQEMLNKIARFINTYAEEAKKTYTEEQGLRKIYSPEETLRRMGIIQEKRNTARQLASDGIGALIGVQLDKIQAGMKMDGSKVNDDAKLLIPGVSFSQLQYEELLKKNKDNYTMQTLIAAHAGKAGYNLMLYGPEEKIEAFKQVESYSKGALTMIDQAYAGYGNNVGMLKYQLESVDIRVNNLIGGDILKKIQDVLKN